MANFTTNDMPKSEYKVSKKIYLKKEKENEQMSEKIKRAKFKSSECGIKTLLWVLSSEKVAWFSHEKLQFLYD